MPPVIGGWLREANDRLGTRLIAANPIEVEDTIRIDGPPARATLNPMLGRIEAPRSVLGVTEPGLISILGHTTVMLNRAKKRGGCPPPPLRRGGDEVSNLGPLSVLGGPYFFFKISLFSPDFGVQKIFVLAAF